MLGRETPARLPTHMIARGRVIEVYVREETPPPRASCLLIQVPADSVGGICLAVIVPHPEPLLFRFLHKVKTITKYSAARGKYKRPLNISCPKPIALCISHRNRTDTNHKFR